MNFKWTYLFIAVVVALVGFTVFDYHRAEKADQKAEADKRVLTFEPSDAIEIRIEGKGEKKNLKKFGDVWQITSPFDDSADQQAVMTFLESLGSERIQEIVKDVSGEQAGAGELDLKAFGLDHPLFVLTLITPQDTQTLKIGAIKAYDGSLYAQLEGQKKVVLVSTAWDVYLSKPARELRDKRVYRGDPAAKAQRVVLVSTPVGRAFKLEFVKDDAGVWTSQGLGSHALREKAVEGYIEKVKALRAFDFMSIESTNKQGLKSIGLDRPGYTISISFEGQTKPFELKFAPVKSSEQSGQTANGKSGDIQNLEALSSDLSQALAVYKIAAQKVMVEPQEFFDPKAPFKFTVSDVAKISIDARDLTPPVKVQFQKSAKGWEKGLQIPADSSKLNEFVSQVSRLEALRFYDPKDSPPKSTLSSSLEFKNATGDVLFNLRWGKPRIEKASGDHPEATVLPVLTNKTSEAVGIPEASIQNLGLEKL